MTPLTISELQALSYDKQIDYIDQASDEYLDMLLDQDIISQSLRDDYHRMRGTMDPARQAQIDAKQRQISRRMGRLAANA